MAEIKYPRLILSPKRHAKLAAEAKKRNMSMEDVGEEKFVAAEKAAK